MGFQNRKPKADANSTSGRNDSKPSFRSSSPRTSSQVVASQPEQKKDLWITIGSLTPSRKLMETSEDYRVLVDFLKTSGYTFSWTTYFGKGVDDWKLFHKDNVLIQFKRFEDDPDFVIGHVSMFIESEDKWFRLGNITATKKGLASNPEYAELVDYLKGVNFSFNLKVWLKNKDDELPLKSRENLLVNFKQRDGDKDFVIGNVVLKA